MPEIKCGNCKQCNRKDKPSVMRYSAYCSSHIRYGLKINRSGLFERFVDFIFNKRYDEKNNKLKTTKGFRPSYFR